MLMGMPLAKCTLCEHLVHVGGSSNMLGSPISRCSSPSMAVQARHCCAPLQGTVRMGRQAADEAYVQMTGQAGQGMSRVLLKGKHNVNRAMQGDMVAGPSMSTLVKAGLRQYLQGPKQSHCM